MDLVHSPAEAM
jgi:hypothetical protein